MYSGIVQLARMKCWNEWRLKRETGPVAGDRVKALGLMKWRQRKGVWQRGVLSPLGNFVIACLGRQIKLKEKTKGSSPCVCYASFIKGVPCTRLISD